MSRILPTLIVFSATYIVVRGLIGMTSDMILLYNFLKEQDNNDNDNNGNTTTITS